MTYGPNAPGPNQSAPFSNVLVNPDAYRTFMKTGQWPNGTQFVLEIRRVVEYASVNNGGRTQGDAVALEASVKDTERFPDGGWAYFSFDSPQGLREAAAPLPRTESCWSVPQHARGSGVDVHAVLSSAVRGCAAIGSARRQR